MLKQLAIKNFKCFQSQLFDLSGVNVLTGLNGSGKSSFIQSLLLLRQMSSQSNNQDLLLNGEYISIGTGQDALFQNAEEEVIQMDLTTSQSTYCWKWGYERESDVLPLKSSVYTKGELQSISLFNDDFYYLATERIGPKTTFDKSNYLVKEIRFLGVHGEYTPSYLAVNASEKVEFSSLLHPNEPSTNLLDQVNAWLGELRPGVRLSVKEHNDLDLVSLAYEFKGKIEYSKPFRSTNVGYGLTNILPILTILLTAKKGSVFLLENPEANLHPRGQSALGKIICLAASNGVQIFLETHSDHIINGIRLAVYNGDISPELVNIQYFDMIDSEDGITANPQSLMIDKDGRIADWPEGFFDEWENTLMQLLIPKEE